MSEPLNDHLTPSLERLVHAVAEEAIFVLAGSPKDARDAISAVIKRRAEVHQRAMSGQPIANLTDSFDTWALELARASAGTFPPDFVPMADVIGEKVTLEAGARGIRSLFSSKPSDKDAARVRRLGTITVQALRAVLAADGAIDADEAKSITWLVASLGLTDADAQTLTTEAPLKPEDIELHGDVDAGVAKAIVRGAWLAAAEDALDTREEDAVRMLAHRLAIATEDVEHARNEAVARVDARRASGLCATEAIRYVLSDRVPGDAVQVAAKACTLAVPRRFREEVLGQIAHGAPIVLAKRHAGLPSAARISALGIAWAAALRENPTLARRSTLRARFDRFAADVGDEGGKVRTIVEGAIDEALALAASAI
ncbi:MAG: hypothetical protein ABI461_20880 [Polyangiaceae bacterium]